MTDERQARRTNILFILADDWGYGDLGCCGNEQIQTPCLDRLAEQGSRYTRFYVSSCVCSPSRCSFITGHYPGRWQIHAHFARYDSNERRHMPHWLDIESPSLPRLMHENGYRTAHYGKWHLGGGGGIHGHPDAPFVKEYGYDDTRTWNGNGPTWYETTPWPFTLHNDPDKVWAANSSRMAADAAIDFIKQDRTKPFFVNLWLKDPHAPLHPTEEQREPFKHLPEPQQTYYSVIHNADRHIGRVLDALDELGVADNTLVIFSSDNGPNLENLRHGFYGSVLNMRGHKGVLYDGGIRVPFIVRWPGHAPVGKVNDEAWISGVDLVPTFLEAAGIGMPRSWNPDGVSALDALHGDGFHRGMPMMWEWRNADCRGNDETIDGWPMLGIRHEEYMLLYNPVSGLTALYDTCADEGQTRNLAADKPDLVRTLAGQIEEYSRSLPGYPTRPGATSESTRAWTPVAIERHCNTEGRFTMKEVIPNLVEKDQRFYDKGSRPTMSQHTTRHAADDSSREPVLGVEYKDTTEGALCLDLYYPAAARPGAGYPLVVYTHGGGWANGSRNIGEQGLKRMAVDALNSAGFCVASVDYRLCTRDGKVAMRDCVTDAKDALRYLAKNAAALGLDPKRVCTFGDSAGAHIAQMLLLSPAASFAGDPALADVEFRVVAGVSWYGPCDFEKTELFARPGETEASDRFSTRILRGDEDREARIAAYREISPANYLRADGPALLMMQGEMDPTMPVHHARYMAERAVAAKAPVEVVIVRNSSHCWKEAGGTISPSVDEIVGKTVTFMKRHLDRDNE